MVRNCVPIPPSHISVDASKHTFPAIYIVQEGLIHFFLFLKDLLDLINSCNISHLKDI
jgi:hypothetical protein